MKLLPAVLTGCLLALPALAIAQDVKIDYDKAYNFAPVKTYTIRIGTAWGNDLSQRRVLEEIDQAIAAKGWKKVNEAQADIHVVLHGATRPSTTSTRSTAAAWAATVTATAAWGAWARLPPL